MNELKTMLKELSFASDPLAIGTGKDADFLATYDQVIVQLLVGLHRLRVINASNLEHPNPRCCALCDADLEAGDAFVRAVPQFGNERDRVRSVLRGGKVAMCVDCHDRCGPPVCSRAALYAIDDEGRAWWIGGGQSRKRSDAA